MRSGCFYHPEAPEGARKVFNGSFLPNICVSDFLSTLFSLQTSMFSKRPWLVICCVSSHFGAGKRSPRCFVGVFFWLRRAHRAFIVVAQWRKKMRRSDPGSTFFHRPGGALSSHLGSGNRPPEVFQRRVHGSKQHVGRSFITRSQKPIDDRRFYGFGKVVGAIQHGK